MLGYIKPKSEELRVREYQYYRAVYCGLCHRMGNCTGQCSRATLSYDFAFLALVRHALVGEPITIQKQRCIIHPFRARPTAQKSKTLDYCADASILLVHHKLMDDLSDERGLKKLRSAAVRPFLSGAFRRARKRLPELNETIAMHLATLSAMEKDQEAPHGADAFAEVFGNLLADVVSYGLDGTNARIAREMGQAIGRWIYLVDAADDFREDKKRGRFNPYANTFGTSPSQKDWEAVRLTLTAHLCRAEQAFLLIDSYTAPEQKEILANILYLGLPKIGKEIAEQKHSDGDQSSKPWKGKQHEKSI